MGETYTIHHELAHRGGRVRINSQEGTPNLYSLWGKRFFSISNVAFRRSEYARKYGMTSNNEDIATVGELIMTEPGLAEKRAKKDYVMDWKIQTMKDFYKQVSGGLMDEQYFEDLKEGKVKRGYWIRRNGSKSN